MRLAMCESALRVLLISRYTTQSKFRQEMKKLHPMNNEALFNVWMLTVRADLKEDGLIEEEGSLVKLTSKGRTVAEGGGYKTFVNNQRDESKQKKRLPYLSVWINASMLIVSIAGLLAETFMSGNVIAFSILSFTTGVAADRLWYTRKRKRK